MHRIIAPLIAASLAGCAASPPTQIPASHPANPGAPTGAIVPSRVPESAVVEGATEPHGGPTEEAEAPAAPQSKALYACPMHPQVTSNDPEARCPECGMRINKPIATEDPA